MLARFKRSPLVLVGLLGLVTLLTVACNPLPGGPDRAPMGIVTPNYLPYPAPESPEAARQQTPNQYRNLR